MTGFRLRPEQQRVVDAYRGGFAAISAVPGAGKTTTLSALAAELIGRIGPRQRVVIVTYQNAAVANFQRAVTSRLEERGAAPRGFMVRTLHALALEVLSSVRHRAELDIGARVIDEADAQDIRDRAVTAAIQRQRDALLALAVDPAGAQADGWPDRSTWRLGKVASAAIETLRPLGGDLDRLRSLRGDGPSWLPFALDVFDAYQRELRERGFLDYDDLVLRAVQALEASPELCRRLQQRWPYLLEDEAQDSTPAQERMLRLLAGEEGNLVRVGDPNQAILTTFTASSVDGFRDWLENPSVQQFELAGSSRSTEVILGLANAFVRQVHLQFPVEEARGSALRRQIIDPVIIDGARQNPPSPSGPRIGLDAREFDRTADERLEVVSKAVAYLNAFPNRTVAILVGRKNSGYAYAEAASEVFPDEKIIRLLSGKDGRPVGLIAKILPLLDFLERPHLGQLLVKALEAWQDIDPQDRVLAAMREHLASNRGSLEAVLYPSHGGDVGDALGLPHDLSSHEQRTLERLRAAPAWLENRLAEPHQLLSLLGATIGVSDEERQLFDAITITVGSVVPDPARSRLEQLRDILEELHKRHRRLRGTHEEFEIRIDPGTLTISTRHQAKGLEWDVVFAVECDDFWFRGSLDFRRMEQVDYLGPFDPILALKCEVRRALEGAAGLPADPVLAEVTERQATEEVSEGLRVMYVTITRARLALWLSWHREGEQSGSNKRRTEAPAFQLLADLISDMRLEAAGVVAD